MKKAFTLAEVLITLGVIGVVAAITLPSFIQNYQTKGRNEQNRMVQYKLTKATDLMKSQGKIGNYATTKDFVNELKKYFKIAQICENDNLEQCWPTKVISTDKTEVNVSRILTGKQLNPNGWSKETIGIITADGTPMILTYKDDCPALDAAATYQWQTEDNKPVTNATAGCIAAIYDLNGKSRPNKSGQDVRLFNASTLAGKFQCYTWTGLGGSSANDKTNGICMMTSNLSFQPMEYGSEEYDKFLNDNSLDHCSTPNYCKPDYWVGAHKTCKAVGGRLPTMSELALIANSMYHTTVSAYETDTSSNARYENPYSFGSNVLLWSSDIYTFKNYAYTRIFNYSDSRMNYNDRNDSSIQARCVK